MPLKYLLSSPSQKKSLPMPGVDGKKNEEKIENPRNQVSLFLNISQLVRKQALQC